MKRPVESGGDAVGRLKSRMYYRGRPCELGGRGGARGSRRRSHVKRGVKGLLGGVQH